jgi:glycosyltransferase involved in cell wall biosynthesis
MDGFNRGFIGLYNNLETLACALRAMPAALSRRKSVVHFLGGTHIFLFLLAFCSRRPIFLSIYGEFLPVSNAVPTLKERARDWLLARVLKAGRLIVICETDTLRDRWTWLLGEAIHTVPYAITPTPPSETKAEARAALGLPLHAPIFLLFGTQREGKDYGVVLRAAKLLDFPVHLLFVGKSISRNNPRQLAEQIGFTHATFVDRFIDDSEVPRFFFAADAAVLPYAEGFDRGSGVILDACAYSRPIVTSRTGYLQWFVETHGVGFLYAPGDAAELATALRQLLALDAKEQESLATRVARTAQLHSWPVVTQEYLRLYRQYSQ